QLPDYPITQLLDSLDSPSTFSTCFVMTSCCATVVFLCSPVTTRGIDPAMSWRARAPAVTTNSKELESFDLSIIFYLCAGAPPPAPAAPRCIRSARCFQRLPAMRTYAQF